MSAINDGVQQTSKIRTRQNDSRLIHRIPLAVIAFHPVQNILHTRLSIQS